MDEQETAGKKGGLLASTLVVSSMTLLSRVLGLVRDVVLARLLGASAGTDAFFVAFRIPNFLRRLFAEGAFNQAFVPVLSEYRTRQRDEGTFGLAPNRLRLWLLGFTGQLVGRFELLIDPGPQAEVLRLRTPRYVTYG